MNVKQLHVIPKCPEKNTICLHREKYFYSQTCVSVNINSALSFLKQPQVFTSKCSFYILHSTLSNQLPSMVTFGVTLDWLLITGLTVYKNFQTMGR